MFSPFSFLFATARPLLALAGLLSLGSCGSSSDPDPNPSVSNVFVVNEGAFQKSDADITGFSSSAGQVVNATLFTSANSRALGDVAQSMTVANGHGYIVVNNSNKVEVVSMPDVKSVATITGLSLPRYFAVSGTKGYVSETVAYSGPGRVSVIDLTTNTVTKTIPVGLQPERMLVADGKVYVVNSAANSISVINTQTDAVESTITVDNAPNSLVQDANGQIRVLCGGKTVYTPTYEVDYTLTQPGSLVSFAPSAPTMQTRLTFASNRLRPTDLQTNGDKTQLYFRAVANSGIGPIFRMGINNNSLPDLTAPFIKGAFYGLGIDPNDATIYGGTGTFSGSDKFIRYRSIGTSIDTFATGSGPNSFVFYQQ